MSEATALEEERFGPVRVLYGAERGKYPQGNSILVEGQRETVLIDPSLAIHPRREALPDVDRILLSHCHEDHLAGCALFPDAALQVHAADHPGITSLDGFLSIYGMQGEGAADFAAFLQSEFHYEPRPNATTCAEGDVFDVGGAVIEVLHTPGHTRGHCCFRIRSEAGTLLYLGDVDLSGFGPYYGDAWSDLEDFERSLTRLRAEEADWYATFHHIGVLHGREAYLERFEKFAARIPAREEALLAWLAEPRSLEEIVAHRFVYRPGVELPWVDSAERRSMSQHLDRLATAGRVRCVAGRWQRVPDSVSARAPA